MDLEDAVAILKIEVRDKCSAYADRALVEVLSLVEEKFTSTNSACQHIFEITSYGVVTCQKCNRKYLLETGTTT